MLEHYFIRPQTVDHVRNAWLGEPIEQYVTWLHENNYAARNIHSRVPLLVQFGVYAQSHGRRHGISCPITSIALLPIGFRIIANGVAMRLIDDASRTLRVTLSRS